MRKIDSESATRSYRLPRIADDHDLIPIAEGLLSPGGNRPLELDFSITDHIDYRALRRFVGRIRRLENPPRPIVLAGLSSYCQAIVHFTLGPSDWDLFTESVEEDRTAASWGKSAAGTWIGRPWPVRQVNELAVLLLAEPCPN